MLLLLSCRRGGGSLTWGFDELLVDSQERRLCLLTALVQSYHLQGGDSITMNTRKHITYCLVPQQMDYTQTASFPGRYTM